MADSRYEIEIQILALKDKFTQSLRDAANEVGSLEQAVSGLNKQIENTEKGRERLVKTTTDQKLRQEEINDLYKEEVGIRQDLVTLDEKSARAQKNLADAARNYAEIEKRDGTEREDRALAEIELTQLRLELIKQLVDAESELIKEQAKELETRDEVLQKQQDDLSAKQKEAYENEQRLKAEQRNLERLQESDKKRKDNEEKEKNQEKISDREFQIKKLEDENTSLEEQIKNLEKRINDSKKRIREEAEAPFVEAANLEAEAIENARLETRKKAIQDRDTIRSQEEQNKVRKQTISDLEREAKAIKNSGYADTEAKKQREKNIENLRKKYVEARGDVQDFEDALAGAQKLDGGDLKNLGTAVRGLGTSREAQRKAAVAKQAAVGSDDANAVFRAEFDGSVAERQALEAKLVIEGIIGRIDGDVKLGLDAGKFFAALPEVIAAKKILARDEKFKISPDLDNIAAAKSINALGALGGAFGAIKDGVNDASRGVAAFDNLIRGLLVLSIALFFQQIFVIVLGLASALGALASSAVAAGGALGGALTAGIAQAIPAIGILLAFINRFSIVLNAVKQANLVQQQESYKGAKAATAQAGALNGVLSAQERVAEAQKKLNEARIKARQVLEDLILSERKQTLGLEQSKLAVSQAISSGAGSLAVAQKQIAVEEASSGLGKQEQTFLVASLKALKDLQK